MLFESVPLLLRVRSNACHTLKVNPVFFLSSSLLPVSTVLLAVPFYHFLELFLCKGSQWRGRISDIVGLCPWILTNSFLEFPNWWSDESIFCSNRTSAVHEVAPSGSQTTSHGDGQWERTDRWAEDGNFQTPPPHLPERERGCELNSIKIFNEKNYLFYYLKYSISVYSLHIMLGFAKVISSSTS